ncbi:MAG: GNAT family N-acetyltransferase [Burkholderiaceae bacterium]
MRVANQIKIRKALPSEWERLVELAQQMSEDSSSDLDAGFFSRGDGRAFVQFLIEKGQLLVAERGSRLVGFCQFEPGRDQAYQTGHPSLVLRALYVLPAERGIGYGHALIEHFLTEARRRGIGRVRAEVCVSAVLDHMLVQHGFSERRREYQLLDPRRVAAD